MSKSQALQEFKQELHISHSQGIEWYYRSLKDKGSLKPLKDLEELFCDSLSLEIDHSDIPIIYKKEAPDKDSVIKMGKGLLKVFYESVDLTGKEIIDVELPLSAQLYTPEGKATELKLIGVLDLVLRDQNGELIVIDNKTAAKPKSQSMVDEDMQFTAYSYLLAANKYVFPTATVNCRMDVLRKLKTPKMENYFTVRTASDRKRFAKIASMVLAGHQWYWLVLKTGSSFLNAVGCVQIAVIPKPARNGRLDHLNYNLPLSVNQS